MTNALFITFEGPEGGGKSTQAKLLAKWMKDRNIPHILTKEPGTEHIEECKKIRELLLDPNYSLAPNAELFLFLADRAQHVEQLIKPNLEKGIHVICDRYSDSTKSYQSARGISRDKIDFIVDFATGKLMPNITFLLDIPIEVGLERAKAKSIYKDGDRMEKEDNKFHKAVRNNFLKLAESITEEHRFRIIDASPPKDIETIHKEIIGVVSKELWLKGGNL